MKIQISLSAAIDRYMEMFKDIMPLVYSEKNTLANIKFLIETFKKDDRIIYVCKLFKQALLNSLYEEHTIDRQELLDRSNKIKNCGATIFRYEHYDFYQDDIDRFQHFLSLNLSKINDYKFNNQKVDKILQDFEQFEDEWKASLKDKGLEAYGEKIITFADGSAWWNLNKAVCDIEGNAMGHCGNAGAPQEGDRILSYRVPTKDGKWKPLLTFILNKQNYLGEMKGRGNDKPLPKFHPVIIKLLEDDIVEGIKGGGYLAENNFSLTDLSSADLNRLSKLEKFSSLVTPTDTIILSSKNAVCKTLAVKWLKRFTSDDGYNTDFNWDNLSLFGLNKAQALFRKFNLIEIEKFKEQSKYIKILIQNLPEHLFEKFSKVYNVSDKNSLFEALINYKRNESDRYNDAYIYRVEILSTIGMSRRKAATRKGTQFSKWLESNGFLYRGNGDLIYMHISMDKVLELLSNCNTNQINSYLLSYTNRFLEFLFHTLERQTVREVLNLTDIDFEPEDFDIKYAIEQLELEI